MVDMVLNDDEKVQQLKVWWKKYGNVLSTILLLCLVSIVGWQYWQRHQADVAQQASIKYESLLSSFVSGDHAMTRGEANELIKNYGSSVYAQIASLILANEAVQSQQIDKAIQDLQQVIEANQQPVFTQLAKIRLARIYLSQQKAEGAITLMHSIKDPLYPALQSWVIAQAYVQQKKWHGARASYLTALDQLPKEAPIHTLITMQMSQLPTA